MAVGFHQVGQQLEAFVVGGVVHEQDFVGALYLLEEEPRNGYQLMQELEERSGGAWRPSPGSIYPALSQLEDEGLVRSDENAGRRAFELTDRARRRQRPGLFDEVDLAVEITP